MLSILCLLSIVLKSPKFLVFLFMLTCLNTLLKILPLFVFGSSLIIETIFSLDGLGRMGFEAAVARDYPVIFGTLFVFGLMGLVVGIISDLMYVVVDPRIDFDRREG